jgi:hypothetical protein
VLLRYWLQMCLDLLWWRIMQLAGLHLRMWRWCLRLLANFSGWWRRRTALVRRLVLLLMWRRQKLLRDWPMRMTTTTMMCLRMPHILWVQGCNWSRSSRRRTWCHWCWLRLQYWRRRDSTTNWVRAGSRNTRGSSNFIQRLRNRRVRVPFAQ